MFHGPLSVGLHDAILTALKAAHYKPNLIMLTPEYGIADPNAAILLSLNKSDASYAISTVNKFYHRLTCEEIDGDDSLTITLAKHLQGEDEDRPPCPKCRPDKMDSEARYRGKH